MANQKDKKAEEKAAAPEQVFERDRDAIEHGDIHVRAVPEKGFRRAGIFFTREETVIPADSLSQIRYDAILNEGMLVALEVGAKKKHKE